MAFFENLFRRMERGPAGTRRDRRRRARNVGPYSRLTGRAQRRRRRGR